MKANDENISDENTENLSTKDYVNVLVDDSWRPRNIEFNSFDTWDFSKDNESLINT